MWLAARAATAIRVGVVSCTPCEAQLAASTSPPHSVTLTAQAMSIHPPGASSALEALDVLGHLGVEDLERDGPVSARNLPAGEGAAPR